VAIQTTTAPLNRRPARPSPNSGQQADTVATGNYRGEPPMPRTTNFRLLPLGDGTFVPSPLRVRQELRRGTMTDDEGRKWLQCWNVPDQAINAAIRSHGWR